jgi:hypothetical protein
VDKKSILLGLVIGVLLGAFFAGIGTRSYSVREIACLNKRYNKLAAEYQSRQRELESNIDQCIGYVETARGITERTGENAGRAVKNLHEAVVFIKQGIEENKNLKSELDSIRSSLYRVRDLAGDAAN